MPWRGTSKNRAQGCKLPYLPLPSLPLPPVPAFFFTIHSPTPTIAPPPRTMPPEQHAINGKRSPIFLCLLLGLVTFCSLFSAETVTAAPAVVLPRPLESKRQTPSQDLHRAHLILADNVFSDIEDILDSPEMDPCQMCLKGMSVAQTFSREALELVPGVLRSLCIQYKVMRLDSCEGKKH